MADCSASPEFCDLISKIVGGVRIIQITKLSSVVSLALTLYDFVLTYDDEVKFMWTSEFGIVKALYFVMRYLVVIVIIIINSVIFLGRASNSLCLSWIRFHWISGVIVGTLTEVPLLLRIYALYDRSQRVLIFILACLCATSLSMAAIASKVMVSEGATMVNFGAGSDMHMCVPTTLDPTYKFFWIPLLLNELILVSLALAKFLRTKRYLGLQASAMDLIVRDSVLYFSGTFPFFMLSHFMWIIGGENYIEFPVGFAICMGSIMSQKIVINMKKYRHDQVNVFRKGCEGSSGGVGPRFGAGERNLEMVRLGTAKEDAKMRWEGNVPKV